MTDATPLPHPLPADDRLTAMGLFVESYTGVRATVEDDLMQGGLSGSEFEVLIRLARSPGQRLSMTALANQSTVSNSGLTRLVDRLAASGLVARVQDQQDRRVFYTVLLPDGLEQVQRVLPSHLDVIDRCLTGVLTPAELDVFTSVLRKIRAIVKPGADPANASA